MQFDVLQAHLDRTQAAATSTVGSRWPRGNQLIDGTTLDYPGAIGELPGLEAGFANNNPIDDRGPRTMKTGNPLSL